jgi:hypothetical protein
VVIIRAPLAPTGCPRAIAPPLTLTRSGSAPVSASQARTTEAKASLTSKSPMSSTVRPARLRSAAVAGIGPVSLSTGSTPTNACPATRASGVRPSLPARARDITNTAAAPSEICEELAAVWRPSSLNAGRSAASDSRVDTRIPWSRVTISPSTDSGTTSRSNRPFSVASAARCCERTAQASHSARVMCHLSAIRSADSPCATTSKRLV